MSEQSSQRALQNPKAPFQITQEGPYRSLLYQTQNFGTDPTHQQSSQNLRIQPNLQSSSVINNNNNYNHQYLSQQSIGGNQVGRQSSQYLIETSPFISNLYKAIDEQKFKNIIDWSENGGHYFVIYSMEKFKQQVLPKVNIKKDEHIFYHPVFRADNKYQLHTIKRKRKGKDNVPQEFEQRLRAEILKHEEIKTQQIQQQNNNSSQVHDNNQHSIQPHLNKREEQNQNIVGQNSEQHLSFNEVLRSKLDLQNNYKKISQMIDDLDKKQSEILIRIQSQEAKIQKSKKHAISAMNQKSKNQQSTIGGSGLGGTDHKGREISKNKLHNTANYKDHELLYHSQINLDFLMKFKLGQKD
eukprot:403333532